MLRVAKRQQPLRRRSSTSQTNNRTAVLPKHATQHLQVEAPAHSENPQYFPLLPPYGNGDELWEERIIGYDIDFRVVPVGKGIKT